MTFTVVSERVFDEMFSSILFAQRKPKTLDKYQKLREEIQKHLEKPFVKDMTGLFQRQSELLIPYVQNLGSTLQAGRITRPSDDGKIEVKVLGVLKRTRPTQERIFRTRISNAMKGSKKINQGVVSVGAKVDFKLFNKQVSEFLDVHIPQLSGRVEEETLQRISRLTEKAIEKGLTVDDLAKNVRSLFKNMAKTRSQVIAQTEIGIAQSVGDNIAAKSTKIDLMKIWSNSRDDKVRPSHQIREAREMSKRFSNGLLFPLEPGAPASEIIRCRCTTLYVPRDEVKDWL